MIVLSSVSYWYPGTGRPALSGISLGVAAGEVVGVVGANESGKTTLCLVAAGLAPRLTGGRLEGVADVPAGVGMLFDSPAAQLVGIHRTVFAEVAFGPCNLALTETEVISRTWEAIDQVGIRSLAERDPDRLSGGERQLVALAALLAQRPAHLVLDEPLSRLDEAGAERVMAGLQVLRGRGTGMLIAEHDTEFLAALGARIFSL